VTLALIHGGQPDALILCHEPTRAHMRGLPGYALPTLEALRDLALRWRGWPTRPASGGHLGQHCGDGRGRGAAYLAAVEARMGLPASIPSATARASWSAVRDARRPCDGARE
jgi:uncharacterized NAD-dependent epimerase/dehydratase family protein